MLLSGQGAPVRAAEYLQHGTGWPILNEPSRLVWMNVCHACVIMYFREVCDCRVSAASQCSLYLLWRFYVTVARGQTAAKPGHLASKLPHLHQIMCHSHPTFPLSLFASTCA